jgi:hypothetical protein
MRPLRAAALLTLLMGEPARASTVHDWMTGLVQGCWACDVSAKLSEIGLRIADQIFNSLASDVAALVGLLMALWILYFAGQMFLPFGPEGQGAWNHGAKKLLHMAIVLTFLQGSQLFWDYVFLPLMASAIGLAGTVMSISDQFESAEGTPETLGGGSAPDYCAAPPSTVGLAAAQSVLASINCPLSRIQSQFSKGILIGVAVASGISCTASAANFQIPSVMGPSNPYSFGILNTVDLLVSGLILIVIFFFGYLLFPILLIDVIVRTVVIASISPLAIGASLFQTTHRITDRAIWALVHCGFTLIFASVIAGLGKATLAYVFSSLVPVNGTRLADWNALVAALEDPCHSGISIDLTTASFYKVCGVGIMMIIMLRESSHMAAEFSAASAGDFTGANKGAAIMIGGAGWLMGRATGAALTKPRKAPPRSLVKRVSGVGEEAE